MTTTFCPGCSAPWPPGAMGCPNCGRAAVGPALQASPGGPGGGRRLSRTTIAILAGAALGFAGIVGVLVVRDRLEDDFHGNHPMSAVCDGEPAEGTADFDEDAGAAGLLLLNGSEGSWNLDGTNPKGVDLVACQTWNTTPARTKWCDYRDSRSGEQFTIEIGYYRAELVMREARTGKVVGTHTVVHEGSDCPPDGWYLLEEFERRATKFIYPEDERNAVLDSYRAEQA